MGRHYLTEANRCDRCKRVSYRIVVLSHGKYCYPCAERAYPYDLRNDVKMSYKASKKNKNKDVQLELFM